MTRPEYTPRRAGKRWLQDAPSYVLDVFDHPEYADRYTVWFGTEDAIHVLQDGTICNGPDRYANTWIRGIGTSRTGATSGALEYHAHDVRMYRYANGRRRIRWQDLPPETRALVQRFHDA